MALHCGRIFKSPTSTARFILTRATSYEKLMKCNDINVRIKKCVEFVMGMSQFEPQELPQLGTDEGGKALAIKTPDGFVTLADS